MPKTPTVKERIISLSKNFSPAEIAEIIGTSVQHVNKTIQKAITSKSKPLLTLANYVAAHRMGIKCKNDLAAFFGVSRMTINRFENRPEIQRHFARYTELRNNKYDLKETLQHLTSIYETLAIFEPESKTAKRINQAIALLSKCDKKDNSTNC